MKKQNSIYTLLIALLCFVSSCDYLGVSDQLAGGLQNTEQVFDNVSYTKRWYANVFAGIPAQLQISVAYFCSIGLYFLV